MTKSPVSNAVICALFAAATAVLSQLAVPLPSSVPITLQTFAVALCGYFLSVSKASVAMTVYILLGAVGVPVFSGFKGGIAHIAGPTGGFIIGFLALAALCGIGFKGTFVKHGTILRIIFGVFGVTACHLLGVIHFSLVMGQNLPASFLTVSAPFLVKDFISVVLAFFAANAMRKILRKTGHGEALL